MGLENFVLMGHSLGAYLSCAYALQYPTRVKHLILVDAWGFGIKPDDDQVVWTQDGENIYSYDISLWARGLIGILSRLNPLAPLRITGPFGKCMITVSCCITFSWIVSVLLPLTLHSLANILNIVLL